MKVQVRTMARKIMVGLAAMLLPLMALAQDSGFFVITTRPTPYRVAVPEASALSALAGTDQAPEKLTTLMREGIGMTGLFEVIPPEAYPALASGGDNENLAAWKLINTDYLIRIDVSAADAKRYQVEFRCFDVKMDKMILGKRYTGEKELFGRMVFRFLDELIFKITGEKSSLEGRIAYVSDATGRNEIRIMDVDGGNDQAITSNRTINLSPSWSPDGTKIVYTDYRNRYPDLYIADVAQNVNFKVYSSKTLNISPEFSPDGGQIAFSHEDSGGNIDIYVMSAGGGAPRRLTTSPANDLSPTWSPDGGRIAFVSDRTGVPQIYLMGAGGEGGGASPLTSGGPYNTDPAWSPDGEYIVYTGRAGGQFDLFLISMNAGQGITQLTSTGANEENPAWSPDSKFLIYSSSAAGSYDIYIMSIYGGTPKRLTKGGSKERMPAWSPSTGE